MIWQAEKCRLKIDEIPIQVTYNSYSMSKGQQLATGIKTAFNLIFERLFGI